jgi:hypothetical protein
LFDFFLFSSASILKVLDKRALQDLVKEIDPNEQLDEDVEEVKYYLTTNRYRNQNNK